MLRLGFEAAFQVHDELRQRCQCDTQSADMVLLIVKSRLIRCSICLPTKSVS